jgi:hypothetical protein
MKKVKIFCFCFILLAAASSCGKDEYEPVDDDTPNTETNDNDKGDDPPTNPKDTVFANAVAITYSPEGVTVNNPYESKGVAVAVSGGNVIVKSTTSASISYVLTGTHTAGSLKIYSDYAFAIGLNGVNIICPDGPALNIQSKQEAEILIVGGTNNRMIDNNIYSEDSEDRKATIFSEGALHFRGSGKLVLKGYFKHAVCSDEYITVAGGDIEIQSAYKDGFHANDLISVTGGLISIVATGDGMECEDGDVEISGGDITVQTTGDAVYNAAKTDVTTSAGIKSSGNVEIKKGSLTITSTGTAGKGINADGAITVGVAGADNGALHITASTTGAKVLVSGNAGGGRPGAGGGMNGDYANPKVIKCEGNLTINSGSLLLTGTSDGGEGLESKATLTINGGYLEILTYDDCINAAKHIQINGGTIYARASGNDAIDSNGDITIAGGLIIAQGSEDGLDSDNTAIQINGGTVVGISGQTMSRFAGTQKYISANVAAGSAIGVEMAGEWPLLFQLPAATTGGGGQQGGNRGTFTVVISLPQFVAAATGAFYSGGSISGGATNAFGYNTGGAYSGGTSQTFTVK